MEVYVDVGGGGGDVERGVANGNLIGKEMGLVLLDLCIGGSGTTHASVQYM